MFIRKEVAMDIHVSSKGQFASTERFLRNASSNDRYVRGVLMKYGELGVQALREATPKRTGKTAASWYYIIHESKYGWSIQWMNSNIVNGENIAILIQRGHGLKNGGYVRGRDYIKPALRPIFDDFANNAFTEVNRQNG